MRTLTNIVIAATIWGMYTAMVYWLGMKAQQRIDNRDVELSHSTKPLIKAYEKALSIAGNNYENRVLDVYMETDDWYEDENDYLRAEWTEYCRTLLEIDSLKNE